VTALFLGGELVFEMDSGHAGLDIGLHELEDVKRATEAGLRVGHNGGKPIARGTALGMLNLIGALESSVDAPTQLRARIRRIERLVGIHGAGGVGVRGDLPAGKVNGLDTGADYLHGLITRHRAERRHVGPLVEEAP